MKLVCITLASDQFLDRDWVIEKRKNILSFSLKSKKKYVPLLISQHPHPHSELDKITTGIFGLVLIAEANQNNARQTVIVPCQNIGKNIQYWTGVDSGF